MSGRGFPSPWTVDEDHDACFIVRDAMGRRSAISAKDCSELRETSRATAVATSLALRRMRLPHNRERPHLPHPLAKCAISKGPYSS
jgi:hypothetical protein